MISTRSLTSISFLLILASCATNDSQTQSGRQEARPIDADTAKGMTDSIPKVESGVTAGDDFQADMPTAKPGTEVVQRGPSPFELPEFRRRFALSYLSETDIEPSLTADEREEMMSIMGLIQKERFLEAAQILGEDIDKDASAVFDFTLANIRFQQDELDLAVKSYEKAIAKFPKFRRAWENLAQIYYRRGDYDSAVDALSHVIEYGGASGVVYGLLGVSHSRLGDDISAESAFRLATMLDPHNKNWRMGLAESFFGQKRYADAASLFGSLIKDDPDNARMWLAQGEAYARMGLAMKAAENFEIVDHLGGSSADSLQNLGDIYSNEKLYDLAVSAYLRAIAKKPTLKLGRILRAARFLVANAALEETNELLEGIDARLGSKIEEGDKKEILKIRARLAVARGEGEEEAAILAKVVELDPLDGDALILLGRYHSRKGDHEKAAFEFERAANIEGFEARAKLAYARMLVGRRMYAKALSLLERVQDLEPRDAIGKFLEQVKSRARSSVR